MNEEDFWRRYFTRLYFLRYKSGIDHSPPDAFMDSLQETEVVFHDSSTPVTSHPRPDPTAMSSEGDTKTGGDELERDDGVNDSAVAKESGTTQGVIGHAEESAALAAEVCSEWLLLDHRTTLQSKFIEFGVGCLCRWRRSWGRETRRGGHRGRRRRRERSAMTWSCWGTRTSKTSETSVRLV